MVQYYHERLSNPLVIKRCKIFNFLTFFFSVFHQNNSCSTFNDLFYFHCLRKTLFDFEKLEMRSVPGGTEEKLMLQMKLSLLYATTFILFVSMYVLAVLYCCVSWYFIYFEKGHLRFYNRSIVQEINFKLCLSWNFSPQSFYSFSFFLLVLKKSYIYGKKLLRWKNNAQLFSLTNLYIKKRYRTCIPPLFAYRQIFHNFFIHWSCIL